MWISTVFYGLASQNLRATEAGFLLFAKAFTVLIRTPRKVREYGAIVLGTQATQRERKQHSDKP
jgi:hypothetical protein